MSDSTGIDWAIVNPSGPDLKPNSSLLVVVTETTSLLPTGEG